MPDYVLELHNLGSLEDLEYAVEHMPEILDRVVDDVVLPILAEHYDASGIKTHSGILKAGITKRGSKGNFVTHHGMGVTVGVDYAQIPYAKWVIEGRDPVRAKNKKALAFRIDGKLVIVKSVRAAPPHPVYEFSEADWARVQAGVAAQIVAFRKGGS